MRELVQEPMNTRSTGMSTIGCAGLQAHVLQRAFGGLLIVQVLIVVRGRECAH